jgi:hypothetical protein
MKKDFAFWECQLFMGSSRNIYRMFILSCPCAQQLYYVESLHLLGHTVPAAMFRNTIKQISYRTPIIYMLHCVKIPFSFCAKMSYVMYENARFLPLFSWISSIAEEIA